MHNPPDNIVKVQQVLEDLGEQSHVAWSNEHGWHLRMSVEAASLRDVKDDLEYLEVVPIEFVNVRMVFDVLVRPAGD